MSFYNSLQSNIGQLQGTGHVVGFEVPFTDTAVGVPPIPGRELHFDNDPLALGGMAIIAGGAVLGLRHRKETKDRLAAQLPAGRDHAEIARQPILRDRLRTMLGLTALTAGLSGAALDYAGPYTEDGVNEIDTMAVVVDLGYESRAKDVDSENGQISRYVAAVDGLTLDKYGLSSLDGIEITYIAAGASPDTMGIINDGTREEKEAVIAAFDNYRDPSQYGTEASGGGDIAGALDIAKGVNPDKVIVLTGDMTGEQNASILDDEEIEGNRRVSVVALGKNGSEVELLGGSAQAPINEALNDAVVGAEDSYTATSMNELEGVIDEIVDGQVRTNVRTDVNLFKKIWTSAAVAAGALFSIETLRATRRRNKPARKDN